MKNDFPYDHHGISGGLTVILRPNLTLDDFCMNNIPGYDKSKYEAVAVRALAGKENVVTVYAKDKYMSVPPAGKKLPVHKFKIENIPVEKLWQYIEAWNFTLANTDYDIEEMEVVG